jgi:hypothetical protein
VGQAQPQGSEQTASSLHLEREAFGKAAEVFDGFWIIATRHRPGLSKHMFEINNRCLVFRLNDAGAGPVLVVFNAVDPDDAVGEVRRIEQQTGLVVRYIISPGGGHHMMLEPWHDAFPGAKVLVGPVRIPRTSHGKKLMKIPGFSTMDLANPLPQFKGQLDAILFHGIYGPDDRQAPGEGAPDTKLGFFKGMLHVMTHVKDRIDELWIHHVPSGTVVGGENLGWFYTAEALRKEPFMFRQMIKPDKIWIQEMARKVFDAKAVEDCWRQILAWPARTVMTYHDPPTITYRGNARAALAEAVKAVRQIGA